MRTFLIAGNWKMNAGPGEAAALATEMVHGLKGKTIRSTVLVCAPFISIAEAVQAAKGTSLNVGAQNLHFEENGAYTGEVSASMLKAAGVNYVIIGHSERREYFGETDIIVHKKVKKALQHGLTPILCVGEVLAERKQNIHFDVVKTQLKGAFDGLSADQAASVVIAYEPVWAIGTGETATPEQAQEMHAYIRSELRALYSADLASSVQILYGGSMKPENAAELLAQLDVDGGLIGGASLKASGFLSIVDSAEACKK